MLKKAVLLLATLTLATPIYAQNADRTEQVQFARGASSKAIKGSIKGYAGANYLVRARAGQRLTVSLRTSNPSSYFNVTALGAEAAMFISSTSGDSFTTTIPSTGEYKVNVYLMRNAARRNAVANYTLTIGLR